MLKVNTNPVLNRINRLAKKHRNISRQLVDLVRKGNRKGGREARKFLAKKGQGISGLTFADSQRRLLANVLRGNKTNLRGFGYELRIRGQAGRVDAGRWIPRGRVAKRLKRAPTPRHPTAASISPQKGLFLVRRKNRSRTQPHFRVLHREQGGRVLAAKVLGADFGNTIRKFWRQAGQIYRKELVGVVDFAGKVRRPY